MYNLHEILNELTSYKVSETYCLKKAKKIF